METVVERMNEEVNCLRLKIDKLSTFMDTPSNCSDKAFWLLNDQLYHMQEYARVLDERIHLYNEESL